MHMVKFELFNNFFYIFNYISLATSLPFFRHKYIIEEKGNMKNTAEQTMQDNISNKL